MPSPRPAALVLRTAAAAAAVALAACGAAGDREATRPGLPPGSPLPGLTRAELGRFRLGEALFNRELDGAPKTDNDVITSSLVYSW